MMLQEWSTLNNWPWLNTEISPQKSKASIQKATTAKSRQTSFKKTSFLTRRRLSVLWSILRRRVTLSVAALNWVPWWRVCVLGWIPLRRGSTNWRLILIVVTHLLWTVKERRAFFPVLLFLQSPIEVPSDWSSMWLWRPELVKVMGLLYRESKGGGYCMSTLRVVWGLRNWEALSLRELEKNTT